MPQVVVAVVSFIGTVGATTVAAVAGAGALSAISVGAMFAIGAGVIAVGVIAANKLISSLYEMPQMDTDASRQRTVRSTVEPQKILYGENLVSGPISFIGTYGSNNRVLAHAIVLAGHEVNAITDIHFDDEVVSNSIIDGNGFVTSGAFGPTGGNQFTEGGINFGYNICKINKHLGASGQTADTDLVSAFFPYTINHKGTGLAYISTHWLMKDDSQSTWDKYAPQNIKAVVQGRKVYDPRTATTAYSDNPALCLADYLTNTTFGMGISSSRIDWDSVSAAANACDVTVSVPGSTEKRFTCNGVLFATDSHKTNINKILSSMNGIMSYTNGQFVIRAGVYEAPSVSLNEDDLAGGVSVKTSVERSDRFNTINGTFIDPSQNYKSTEFPEVFTTAARNRDNGEILTKEIQLPMTNSRYMAQRIANKLIQQSDQQKVLTFPTNLSGMEVAVGDRVNISLEEFNWSNKVFMCLGWTLSDSGNGGINLILREDDSASYADPAVGEYSTISAAGALVEGFRGVPDPQNLSATAGLKSIELNWTNPENMDGILFIEVFASETSAWSGRVKIGETNGTQFFHDASTTADPLAIGDTRYYWIRARAYSGSVDDATTVSDRNPDNDTSTISATVGGVDFDDVVGDTKPEDNATVGATVGVDLVDDDGVTVLTHDDIINAVLRIDLTAVQIETGEVLDLETGQDVLIQNLGDVAIYVNESNQIINASISSVRDTVTGLEATLVDLVSGVSDVYVKPEPPVAGVDGIPDPIPTFSRWYDSDDSNAPYYWNDTEWVSLADPRIASNAAAITTLESGLNTANSNISANSSAIDVLETTTIAQGDSITSLSSDVTTLQTDLTAAEGDITTNATAISSLTTRVTAAEGSITTNATDITALETTVNDETTGLAATASAVSALDTRVTQTETDITTNATDITALETTVNDATTGVAATASALSALTTRVTSAEDAVDAHTADITALEVTVNDETTGVAANASAISSLDSRVTVNEGAISSTASDTTALEVSFTDLTKIQGEADAVITTEDGTDLVLNLPTDVAQATSVATTALDARVTSAEGTITSQSSAITQLQSDLTTLDGEQEGTATALSALTTRVTTAENSITVNSTDITALESSLTTANGNITANASAISSLDTRVTSAEGSITVNSSDITSLESSLATTDGNVSANATAISSLDTRVTSAEGSITSQASDITELQSDLTTLDGTVSANSTALTALTTRVTTAEGEITSNSTDITTLTSSLTSAQGDITTNASAISALDTRVTSAEGTITSQSSDITSLQSSVTSLNTSVSGNATAISGLDTRVTSNEGDITSQATALTSLTSTVGTNTTSITNQQTTINGITAQYTVTIDNNDHISGFGLVSDIIAGNPTSAFIVNADQFAIGGAGVITDEYPFVVYTTEQTVSKNGTNYTIPAGVYIKDAFIQNAAIESAQIQNAAITSAKIDDLAVDTIKIADQAVTIPSSTELASSYTWGGTTAIQSIMTHTFTGTGATAEVLSVVTAGGAGSPNLTLYWYHNGVFKRQQAYVYGGVMVFPITTTSGSNTIELKASLSSTVGTCIIPTAYIRTLETKK